MDIILENVLSVSEIETTISVTKNNNEICFVIETKDVDFPSMELTGKKIIYKIYYDTSNNTMRAVLILLNREFYNWYIDSFLFKKDWREIDRNDNIIILEKSGDNTIEILGFGTSFCKVA